jgi:hypothetical protein
LRERAEAEKHLVFQRDHPLFRRIRADGFAPASPEFPVEVNGIACQAQRAERLERVRVYYVPDGGDVQFLER